MWQKIRNRPLNVTYGDIRTSAERENSIQQHSQLFVQVTQRTWEDCSNTGANKRQADMHHALAIVRVASEGHEDVLAVQCIAHSRPRACMNICLRSDNSGWYVTRTFHFFRWWELHARILILKRRLQQRLWTVCPRRWVLYRAKGQGCVARSIHIPDTRKGLCLTRRCYKPIYVVCFNGCQ
jgi:hypothetical protein